jgi:DNA-binding MarR family transcriptional regulator
MDRTGFVEHREEIAEAFEAAAVLLLKHLADRAELSLTSVVVLSTLGAEGPVRLTALAGAVGVRQPSMTQLVQRLERDGLVTRVSDPVDGRGTLVGITEAGRGLLVDRRRDRRRRLAALLRALSAEDEAALTHAMHVARPILQRLIDEATVGEQALPGALAPSSSPQGVPHDG